MATDQFPPAPQANQILIPQYIDESFPHFAKHFPIGNGPDPRLTFVGVTPSDYVQLLQTTNDALNASNPCSGCNWVLLCCSIGMCFCPMLYMGFAQQAAVRGKLAKSPVVQRLQHPNIGITVEYYKGDRHIMGAIMLTLDANAIQRVNAGVAQFNAMQQQQQAPQLIGVEQQ